MSVETSEFMAMLRRMVRAAGRRVAEGDEPELQALVEISVEVDEAIKAGVQGMRASGSSWSDIGRALGVTKQAAQKRFQERTTA